jgi:hypothetical protein
MSFTSAMAHDGGSRFPISCEHGFVGTPAVNPGTPSPGATQFHCHIQRHMDFGFKALPEPCRYRRALFVIPLIPKQPGRFKRHRVPLRHIVQRDLLE